MRRRLFRLVLGFWFSWVVWQHLTDFASSVTRGSGWGVSAAVVFLCVDYMAIVTVYSPTWRPMETWQYIADHVRSRWQHR
jgi:hypothetical protein